MAENRFVELIFEPSASRAVCQFAYQSLARHPEQLFALLLMGKTAIEFAAALPLLGRRLSSLLRKVPEHFDRLQLGSQDKLLYEETLSAFIFTLLPWTPEDIASQEAVADIVMAVIETARPEGGRLQLLGAELGRNPRILERIISEGSLATFPRKKQQTFKSLALKSWESWAAVANAIECKKHLEGWLEKNVTDWRGMMALVESFPCDQCSPTSTEYQTRLSGGIGFSTRVFENLLGEHLGPWKIVISALAVNSLKNNVTEGTYTVIHSSSISDIRNNTDQLSHVQRDLLALASGNWERRFLQGAPHGESAYRVPVYMILCPKHAIIWQVDGAFDERHDRKMQVLKGTIFSYALTNCTQ